MKPTKTQKTVIETIRRQLTYWRDSNDINSPTHFSDMEDELDALCDCLSIDEITELNCITNSLLKFIKNLAV